MNDTQSERRQVSYGVPQGSTLGTLLFILYVNDLNKSIYIISVLFADDTSIFMRSSNYTALINQQPKY